MKQNFSILFVLAFVVLTLVTSDVQFARANGASATTLPVVFIPGIGGSRLADSNNVEYWTAAGYSGHDLLTLYPNTPHPTLYATSALTEATFLGVHVPIEDWQTYGPVLAYFQTQGFVPYQTNEDPAKQTSAGCDLTQAPNHPNLFVFAYDWRQSNAGNATLLADYVACVQMFYPNTQINLVAHSMGGLVARRYILQYNTSHHVNALVSVSSPYVGASKLVWVEETGNFIFFVWASTLLDIVGSFNGASELMNSQAWYDLGGAPALIENGQDLNNDGKTNEKFSYSMLVQYMNTAKGQQGFLPGTQNQNFHSYSNGGNLQDDWRSDTTGVKYFHIYGAGLVPDTINQVVAASAWECALHYKTCDVWTQMYPKFTQGDATVPLLSLSRMGATLDYNAPNATLYECQAFGANNQNVDHTGLLSNPVVQNLITGYLTQANGGATVNPPPTLACGQGQTTLAPQTHESKFHQVVLHGAKEIKVSDGTSDELPDTVAQYNTGKNTTVLTLGSGKSYTITFRGTKQPLYLEWLYRDEKKPRRAMRFRDKPLLPNALAQFTLSDGAFSELKYDTNNDDTVDTLVPPTTDLQGTVARDLRAPKVKFSALARDNRTSVTLAATDNLSGVANIVYSLDGKHFQIYKRPFVVDASVKTIYAFADDHAGNRSRPFEFQIP